MSIRKEKISSSILDALKKPSPCFANYTPPKKKNPFFRQLIKIKPVSTSTFIKSR